MPLQKPCTLMLRRQPTRGEPTARPSRLSAQNRAGSVLIPCTGRKCLCHTSRREEGVCDTVKSRLPKKSRNEG